MKDFKFPKVEEALVAATSPINPALFYRNNDKSDIYN